MPTMGAFSGVVPVEPKKERSRMRRRRRRRPRASTRGRPGSLAMATTPRAQVEVGGGSEGWGRAEGEHGVRRTGAVSRRSVLPAKVAPLKPVRSTAPGGGEAPPAAAAGTAPGAAHVDSGHACVQLQRGPDIRRGRSIHRRLLANRASAGPGVCKWSSAARHRALTRKSGGHFGNLSPPDAASREYMGRAGSAAGRARSPQSGQARVNARERG